ncbi:hypothetical protein Tco_0936408 [Tanacetum coccineum]
MYKHNYYQKPEEVVMTVFAKGPPHTRTLDIYQLNLFCEIVLGYDIHLFIVPSYLNITFKNLAWVLWLQVLRQNNGRLGVADSPRWTYWELLVSFQEVMEVTGTIKTLNKMSKSKGAPTTASELDEAVEEGPEIKPSASINIPKGPLCLWQGLSALALLPHGIYGKINEMFQIISRERRELVETLREGMNKFNGDKLMFNDGDSDDNNDDDDRGPMIKEDSVGNEQNEKETKNENESEKENGSKDEAGEKDELAGVNEEAAADKEIEKENDKGNAA